MVHCTACNQFWKYNKKNHPGRRCPSCQSIMNFKCGRCGRIYKLLSSLKKHLRYVCHKEPSFTCSFCDYKSCRRYTMANHLLRKHQVATDSYKCPNCHEIFTNNLKMEKHLRLCSFASHPTPEESSDSLFFCNDCDFKTMEKINLMAHIHYNHSESEFYYPESSMNIDFKLKPLNLSKPVAKTPDKAIVIPAPVNLSGKSRNVPGILIKNKYSEIFPFY